MAEIIDLTVSPQPEIIEILSDQEKTPLGCSNRTQENKKLEKKKRKKKGKSSNGLSSDDPTNSSGQPSRAHSQEIGDKSLNELNGFATHPQSTTTPRVSPTTDVSNLFFSDYVAVPLVENDYPPEPEESTEDGDKLLLPSHVTIFHSNGPTPASIVPPPILTPNDEQYIEYLDFEDRKDPGMIRYFEVEERTNQSKPSISKCKNCGAEGDHKTYDCPVQICLTCGARDEHSTRSCPISKTCYTCGMKGHINKTCPNRFSARAMSSDFHGDCDRCGSTKHKMNECPTLWRIYKYVNEEERILIVQSREQEQPLAIGDGGEGYNGGEMWCYNCANTGHLGDNCDELPHPATFPTEHSAFSSHNTMSGPFYDPAAEPVSIRRGRERDSGVDQRCPSGNWEASSFVDVGKRGRNKDKEKLEKRFREQEDEGEDWFNDMRNVKKRGMDQAATPRGRRFKFGSFNDGGREHSSPPRSLPPNGGGLSLLARIGEACEGREQGKAECRNRHEAPQQFSSPIRIRGAANDQRNRENKYANANKVDWEPGQGGHRGPRRGHGPRYKGGYDYDR